MLEKIQSLQEEIQKVSISTKEELEKFRLDYISKKGQVSTLFDDFKSVPNEQKKAVGQALNVLKNAAQDFFKSKQEELESQDISGGGMDLDFTLPAIKNTVGSLHPLTLVRNRIVEIFQRIGFNVSDGPEIEKDWYNFTSLNFPENHPAREMQDTFFIEKNPDLVLRTHTSSIQARVMEAQDPPIRTLSPGRVFRNEAISARAHCIFHQIEGLYIDKNVSFKDLKQVLLYFAKEFFGKDTKIRLRPSFFPFTEPSAELDIYWGTKTEADRKITKGTGWLEIGGCGMVDPNVLKNCNIDPEVYSGYAFGMGVERIAMLKYQIKDLRLFTENDVRFLKQFKSVVV